MSEPLNKSTDIPVVFDRRALGRHRARAARLGGGRDALIEEVADRLADRLDDVRREFPRALVLGRHRGAIVAALRGRGGIRWQVEADFSTAFSAQALGPAVAADEERLPFADGAFDLVVSCFQLHWVNDLPGALIQIRRVLRPDGLFLAAFPGGGTLSELRAALAASEIAAAGGMSPRVVPFIDVRDAGQLLQRAGFTLPVADSQTITARYREPLDLLRDLRALGETNCLAERIRTLTPRATLAGALSRLPVADDGRVPATFQIVFLTGWAPHPTQPKPLPRGSGQVSLADALKAGGSA